MYEYASEDVGGGERSELEKVHEHHAVAVHPAEALQLVDSGQLRRSLRRQIVLPPTPCLDFRLQQQS